MRVKIDNKYDVCCKDMVSHSCVIDQKGTIIDVKLGYKFDSIGEILAYVERLEKELKKRKE